MFFVSFVCSLGVFFFGSGSYFTKLTVSNLVAGNSFFSLHFDETVTAQKKKQMDLLVQFWSDIHNEVKVKYLTSIMFGHAKAADVVTEIMQVLENLSLPFKLMLSFGMDGPNVNKSILAKLNELKKEKGYPELVQIPITLDMMNAADKSHSVYSQYLREEELKKKKKRS